MGYENKSLKVLGHLSGENLRVKLIAVHAQAAPAQRLEVAHAADAGGGAGVRRAALGTHRVRNLQAHHVVGHQQRRGVRVSAGDDAARVDQRAEREQEGEP